MSRTSAGWARSALSYRDVEELLAERGVEVGHVTVCRWVQRFTPLLIEAARPCRHSPGDRWFADEPTACHVREKDANSPIEADHGRLKVRLRPMRGLTRLPSTRVICAGHAFVQNIHRSHYELRVKEVANLRVLAAFDQLALAI
jgi:transposase-like protein